MAMKKEIESYYNKINLVALSPPGAHIETIPEKPDILIIVERIESSGKLLLDGGLMQQPHIFMEEYYLALSLKKLFDSISANQNQAR